MDLLTTFFLMDHTFFFKSKDLPPYLFDETKKKNNNENKRLFEFK